MKANVNVPEVANDAGRMARGAATSKWMIMLARFGYAIKGVVYLIIGILAIQLAAGQGGKATDQRGALHTIASFPFGQFLLVAVTVGLFSYALWCFIQAIFDTEGKGHDAKGILARVGYAAVGFANASLAIGALSIVTNVGSSGKNSTTQSQDWTGLLLKEPFGVVLVIIVGLVVLGVAGYLFYTAYSAKFKATLALTGKGAQLSKWVIYAGRLGYSALGVVFTIIGIFMIVAAIQHNSNDAKGLDTALSALSQQPFGTFLLGIVALGLIAYGLYSFVEARYRKLGRN